MVPKGPVRGMGYVPRGRLLVVGGDDGFLALVDPRRGQVVKRLAGHGEKVVTPSFSADGRLMATASDDAGDRSDGVVRLWTLPSGAPAGRPLRYPTVGGHIAQPRRAHAGCHDRHRGRRDRRCGPAPTPRRRCWGPRRCGTSCASRPTGAHRGGGQLQGLGAAVVRRGARRLQLRRRMGAGQPQVRRPRRPTGVGQSISPTATHSPQAAATAPFACGTCGRSGARRRAARPAEPLSVSPQFTPDGAHLFALTNAGRAYRWDVRPASWARHACAVAGRRLTRSEWRDALPERDYNPAC